jgi:CubicO group peptidase (beta-lactamase class C family)
MTDTPIGGFAEPGFERVWEAFEQNFADGHEVGATCAVVVDGELVVDL